MVFDYNTLKEMSNSEIGNWNGWKIFVTSVEDLEKYRNKPSNTLYILYDDENNVVYFDTATQSWKLLGNVTMRGQVITTNPKLYKDEKKQLKRKEKDKKNKKEESAAITYSPGYEIDEKPTGDVKIDLVIEDMLSRSRDLTVSELLEGFNQKMK